MVRRWMFAVEFIGWRVNTRFNRTRRTGVCVRFWKSRRPKRQAPCFGWLRTSALLWGTVPSRTARFVGYAPPQRFRVRRRSRGTFFLQVKHPQSAGPAFDVVGVATVNTSIQKSWPRWRGSERTPMSRERVVPPTPKSSHEGRARMNPWAGIAHRKLPAVRRRRIWGAGGTAALPGDGLAGARGSRRRQGWRSRCRG